MSIYGAFDESSFKHSYLRIDGLPWPWECFHGIDSYNNLDIYSIQWLDQCTMDRVLRVLVHKECPERHLSRGVDSICPTRRQTTINNQLAARHHNPANSFLYPGIHSTILTTFTLPPFHPVTSRLSTILVLSSIEKYYISLTKLFYP